MKEKRLFVLAAVVTVAALIVWQATGGDYYTKFEVVEQVEKEIDPDDPLAAAGFYDDESQIETIVKDEFRFGLLPVPNRLFDKHMLAVTSLSLPFWLLAAGVSLWQRRKNKKGSGLRDTVPSALSS